MAEGHWFAELLCDKNIGHERVKSRAIDFQPAASEVQKIKKMINAQKIKLLAMNFFNKCE